MAEPTESEALCRLSDIPDGGAVGVVHGAGAARRGLILVRAGAQVRAYVNRCPHTGVSLDWVPGRFLDPEGRHLQCATHGALFQREDGLCIAGPCVGQSLEPVPVRVRAGLVLPAQ